MNAHCEWLNRTIQEEFIDDHEEVLFADIAAFNEKQADWLIGYNRDRPHFANRQSAHIEAVVNLHPKYKRSWTHTMALDISVCRDIIFMLPPRRRAYCRAFAYKTCAH